MASKVTATYLNKIILEKFCKRIYNNSALLRALFSLNKTSVVISYQYFDVQFIKEESIISDVSGCLWTVRRQ